MHVNQARIKGFDGLRGIAVIMVVMAHKVSGPTAFGNVGVWLFFVLSGFLIVRILARARESIERSEIDPSTAAARFFWRRASRLLPIYYLVLGGLTLSSLALAGHGLGAATPFYWLHSTHVLVAIDDAFLPQLGHLWSLGIEEQFYLLAAPLLLFCPRKHTLAICCAIVGIGALGQALLAAMHASETRTYVSIFANFAMLAFGGIVGLCAERPLPRALTSGGAQLIALMVFLSGNIFFRAAGWGFLPGQVSAVLAGLLLLQIYQRPDTQFVRALEGAPFAPIGKISYGLYLYHPLVNVPVHDNPGLAACLNVGIAGLMAAVSWRYLEQPAMAWAARHSRARQTKSAGGSRPFRSEAAAGSAHLARSSDASDRHASPAYGS